MSGLIGALGGLLLSISGSVVTRALVSLGIGWVTFEGLSASASAMSGSVVTAWGSMPSAVIQYLGLAGANEAVGIVLGALAARVAMVSLAKLGKVT